MHIITPSLSQFDPTQPSIILDRDGVLNDDRDDYIKNEADITIIPAAKIGIDLLTKLGYNIFIATNQQCINKNIATQEDIMHVNDIIITALNLQPVEIHMCPHQISEHCPCRKPQPGMLNSIISRYDLDPKSVVFVGDKPTDREAADAAGLPFVHVQSGEWPGDPQDNTLVSFKDLSEFAQHLQTHNRQL